MGAHDRPGSVPVDMRAHVMQIVDDMLPETIVTSWLGIVSLIVAFISLIATIALGINQLRFLSRSVDVAAQSAQAAKQSAETARDALIVSNRPWVSVFRPSIESQLTWDEKGGRVTIGVKVNNIGKSPAFDIAIGVRLFVLPSVGIPLQGFCYDSKRGYIARKQSGPSERVDLSASILFPEEIRAEHRGLLIAPDIAEEARTSPKYIGVLICANYESKVTGQAHSTGVAYMLSKPPSERWQLTPDEAVNSNELSFTPNPLVSLAD
jgi:hypothetical protein